MLADVPRRSHAMPQPPGTSGGSATKRLRHVRALEQIWCALPRGSTNSAENWRALYSLLGSKLFSEAHIETLEKCYLMWIMDCDDWFDGRWVAGVVDEQARDQRGAVDHMARVGRTELDTMGRVRPQQKPLSRKFPRSTACNVLRRPLVSRKFRIVLRKIFS